MPPCELLYDLDDGARHLTSQWTMMVLPVVPCQVPARVRHLKNPVGGGAQGEAIVATLAAVAFLEAHAAEHKDKWSSLGAKATRWVEAALAALGQGGAFDPLSHEVGLLV